MRLYIAASAQYARDVVEHGFRGVTRHFIEGGSAEFCEFRDQPPVGLTFSITTEMESERTDDGQIKMTIGGGPVLADDIGDFILSVDIPDTVAAEFEVHEDEPAGWPFREYWLPPKVANAHRHKTMQAFVSDSGEEIAPRTLFMPHAVFITERFTGFPTEAGEAGPVGALCVCGERWRWNGKDEDDPRVAFPAWAAGH